MSSASGQKRDYYEVLGVQRNVNPQELKSAFRKVALQYHPDRNQGNADAEEKFKEASEAYEVLSDAERRARYDRFGHQGNPFEGFGGAGFQGVNLNEIFGDLFGDIFGQRQRRGGPQRGADLRHNLEISFEEAAFGTEVTFKIAKPKRCEVCSGRGGKEGSERQCPTCNGSGELRFTQGFFAVTRPCNQCSGAGRIISDPCKVCSGSGRLESESTLTVNIPAGVNTGTRVRVSGEGELGDRGGPNGDLHLFIHVKEHPLFVREDYDVFYELPISFTQAALGASIDVPTLEGKHKLKIPGGTQTGKVFPLRGKGIPHLHSGKRGDLVVQVKVETPTELSGKQRELLEKLAEISGEETHPQAKSFFSKVREIFG
jgi:molecular chaperone DnaJ